MSDTVPLADFQGLSDDATRYLMELSVLRAENARLRAALTPFANMADAFDFYNEDACPTEDDMSVPKPGMQIDEVFGFRSIGPDQFRDARAALSTALDPR